MFKMFAKLFAALAVLFIGYWVGLLFLFIWLVK
jgi:hypothetical protein